MPRSGSDGWPATPLTTDRAAAEHEAYAVLDGHHAGEPGPVYCLTARYRTAVFALGTPPRRIVKRHADEAAYQGEVLAYELLVGECALPDLHRVCDASRTLSSTTSARPSRSPAPMRSTSWPPPAGIRCGSLPSLL
ncbi:hypothetical protein [Streptomyces nojiriensis]|uniref:hypothetical protein n=1 Tax=Streptomyces nojiriensis TaxID=66374 RepID=UPI0036650CD3